MGICFLHMKAHPLFDEINIKWLTVQVISVRTKNWEVGNGESPKIQILDISPLLFPSNHYQILPVF